MHQSRSTLRRLFIFILGYISTRNLSTQAIETSTIVHIHRKYAYSTSVLGEMVSKCYNAFCAMSEGSFCLY